MRIFVCFLLLFSGLFLFLPPHSDSLPSFFPSSLSPSLSSHFLLPSLAMPPLFSRVTRFTYERNSCYPAHIYKFIRPQISIIRVWDFPHSWFNPLLVPPGCPMYFLWENTILHVGKYKCKKRIFLVTEAYAAVAAKHFVRFSYLPLRVWSHYATV